jgi:hypothetical protein
MPEPWKLAKTKAQNDGDYNYFSLTMHPSCSLHLCCIYNALIYYYYIGRQVCRMMGFFICLFTFTGKACKAYRRRKAARELKPLKNRAKSSQQPVRNWPFVRVHTAS